MDTRHRASLLSSVIVFFIALLAVLPAHGAEPATAPPARRIALLPFTVHAAKDMSYLTSGIRDMLATRLAAGAGAKIVDKTAIDQALATAGPLDTSDALLRLGRKLKTDYLVTGSLTALGGGLSIDAKVYSVSGPGAAPRNFFASAAKENEVITAINSLAWDINEKVFGATRPATAPQSQAATVPAAPARTPYQTAHPDRIFHQYEGGVYGGTAPLVRPMGVITGPMGFTKSRNFRFGLIAMDVGDVDGNGRNEFVLASENEIRVFRREAGRLQKIGQVRTGSRYKIHFVTLADLNHNGREEIYVSAADAKEPNSFVLEWDGKQFNYIYKDLAWYVRVIKVPGEGPVLAGQKAGFNYLVAKGLYRLNQTGSGIQKGARLPYAGVNLFDFSLADLDGDGVTEVVAISQGDKLMVLRPSGKDLWISDDYYGGTTKYLGGESFDEIDKYIETDNEAPRLYIPARIIIRDINNDGQPDVIINKNLSTASRLLNRAKSYPSGEIHALTWNGIGLTELWRTRKIDGYISDYQLGPVTRVTATDKAGPRTMAELYVGLVLRSGGLDILKDSTSTVLTYQLDLSRDKRSGETAN